MNKVYFSKNSFAFLRALARNNSRPWFQAHAQDYERHVREPFLTLIADLQAPLAKSQPALPRRSAQDRRFAVPHLSRHAFRERQDAVQDLGRRAPFHERRREIAAPSFYLHIAPKECFAGGGIWHPEPPTLKRIRNFLVDNPAAWKSATQSKAFREHFEFLGRKS